MVKPVDSVGRGICWEDLWGEGLGKGEDSVCCWGLKMGWTSSSGCVVGC
jgi:hypothetical protein